MKDYRSLESVLEYCLVSHTNSKWETDVECDLMNCVLGALVQEVSKGGIEIILVIFGEECVCLLPSYKESACESTEEFWVCSFGRTNLKTT